MTPLVSILLPVYNGERYLEQAIRSVLAQEYANWELIVQDDCSSDASAAIVASFADPRIRYERNPRNLHIAATLNRALRRSRGEFVQAFCQDDRMLPGLIREHVGRLAQTPRLPYVFCELYMIDAAGERLSDSFVWEDQYKETPEVCSPASAMLLFYCFGCLPGNLSSVMARREVLIAAGGFDTTYRVAFDWEMWIRLAAGAGLGFVPRRLVEVRSHGAQESVNARWVVRYHREVRQCLSAIEGVMPLGVRRQLSSDVRLHYAAAVHHQAVRCLLRGRLRETVDLFALAAEEGRTAAALWRWFTQLPVRALSRVRDRQSRTRLDRACTAVALKRSEAEWGRCGRGGN